MNRAHLEVLASPWWANYLETELLPWVLGATDLGDDVLEAGRGRGSRPTAPPAGAHAHGGGGRRRSRRRPCRSAGGDERRDRARFRHLLETHRLTVAIFEAVKELLTAKRLLLQSGRQPDRSCEQRRHLHRQQDAAALQGAVARRTRPSLAPAAPSACSGRARWVASSPRPAPRRPIPASCARGALASRARGWLRPRARCPGSWF